jgi:flagellar hook-associated protein 1 FlgK
MTSLVNLGLSGLKADQTALDVTGQNIANVDTPGYTEQTAELGTATPQSTPQGWLGTGVDVETVQRQYSALLAQQAQTASNSVAQLTAFSQLATSVSNMFGDQTTGVSVSLSNFENAVQTVSTDPTSAASRSALLGQAQTLVNQLKSYNSQLGQDAAGVSTQVTGEVTSINTLAQGIAQLNSEIVTDQSATGQPPNDLLDQRDSLLSQLATHISVTTSTGSNGVMNVSIGNGESLVTGGQAATLVASSSPTDASQQSISIKSPAGTVDITNNVSGGTLGGLLNAVTQVINPALDSIGQIAAQVTQLVNTQNNSGLDLNGALGPNLLSIGGPTVLNGAQNTGSETVTATISNASALTGSNYTLNYTSGGWTLTNLSTGANVAMTGTGTSSSPLVANGVSMVVTGTPHVGDSFEVEPTRNVISSMAVLTTDPNAIAAAAAVTSSAGTANTGTGSIAAPSVQTPSNANLLSPVTIAFLTPTTYSVNGSGSYTYTSGANIDLNGWQTQISGAPAAGDTFTVQSNAGATGDNSNALLMANILQQPVLDNGTTSVSAAAASLVTSLGVTANQATNSLSAQTVVSNDATAALANASGVDLNTEAANMLQYEQAYQASAQVIKMASDIFNTLLTAVQSA